MSEESKKGLQDLITEDDLQELLGIGRQALGRLRNEEGLPFLRVNQNNRVYLVDDVMEWLVSRRVKRQV